MDHSNSFGGDPDLYIVSYFIVYPDWSEDFVMSKKPTYEELKQRVKGLEKAADDRGIQNLYHNTGV